MKRPSKFTIEHQLSVQSPTGMCTCMQIVTPTMEHPENPLSSCNQGADAMKDCTAVAEMCQAAAEKAAVGEDDLDEPPLLVSCILGACSRVQAWTPGIMSAPVSVATRAAITATAAASAICTAVWEKAGMSVMSDGVRSMSDRGYHVSCVLRCLKGTIFGRL